MRLLVGCVLVLALAGCTDGPESESVDRAFTEAPSPSPSPTSGTAEPTLTTRPLVLAVNARRERLVLTERQARRVERGEVTDWAQLGQPAGPLRVNDRTDDLSHLPMDTIALVVADAMTPAVRAAIVGGVDPLRDPAAYPLQVQGPPAREVTTLTVVGDIMLGRRVTGRPALEPMSDRLAAADITVGNLESTLAVLGPPNPVQGDPFHAPPSVRRDLRAAGFDALSLANNHTGDYGDASLMETERLLRVGGLRPFGAGRDLAAARKPAVLERDGVRFGFLGFNAIGETAEAGRGQPGAVSVSMPPRTGPLDRAELDRVLGDVRRLSRRVDVVVVLPHWGEQYTYRPQPVQHRVARELARAGADLVVGGHPHWVQGAEQIGDTLVVHSLGNFVFDMDFYVENTQGLVLETTWWGDQLMAADFVPYVIGPDFAPRVVPVDEAEQVLTGFWQTSRLARP